MFRHPCWHPQFKENVTKSYLYAIVIRIVKENISKNDKKMRDYAKTKHTILN